MSVFTYDENPTRVSSPWPRPVSATPENGNSVSTPHGELGKSLSDYGITKLEAEPQDGPIEYKLHLLLRPRIADRSMSTGAQSLLGSSQFGPQSESKAAKPASTIYIPPNPSNQARQDRLVHLTTQLLWRLQQTCPYHAASRTAELVVPQLPLEAVNSDSPPDLSKLIPGLEASRGALYEIGVADDGTITGLTREELDESLRTLRVMAASLGCNMEVLQQIIVGKGQLAEDSNGSVTEAGLGKSALRREDLWVAEALVTPDPRARDDPVTNGAHTTPIASLSSADLATIHQNSSTRNQLRVTLTGPSTSGKSTLLGTLSTGTLDDGRGRSRQSSLKHLHEVATGVTSSVAQELIGYNHNTIYNYQHGGIESWIDIHDFTRDGRLVFLLDPPGKNKYRRTILRGIVGWAPHWTILCIAANESEAQLEPEPFPGMEGAGNAAKAHLDLCLKLGLPFVIAITKLDTVDKRVLASTLRPIIDRIKAHGRAYKLVQGQTVEERLMEIPARDVATVSTVTKAISAASSLEKIVPIVLTSAAKGDGIGAVHALLQGLPLPPIPTSQDYIGPALNPEQPTCLFHIDDQFDLPASYATFARREDEKDLGTVVAGHLRFGSLSIGDNVLVGPFPSDDDNLCGDTPDGRSSPGNFGLSTSHPSSTELGRIAMRNAVSASAVKGQWHHADIVSIRNLRLPVQTLHAGQAGSIGLVIHVPKEDLADSVFERITPAVPTPRKGMVLAVPSKHMVDTGVSLQAASELTASFPNIQASAFAVGGVIHIYIASVRAAARVLRVSQVPVRQGLTVEEADHDFALIDQMDGLEESTNIPAELRVRLGLLTNREWVELGSQIVISEGAGLDCHVGRIVEIVD